MLKMKKVLAVTLAATTILGTSLTAFATTEAATSSSEETAEEAVVASSTVAGVASTTPGINFATAVTGSAVTTPAANIAAAYNLGANEKAFSKFYNFDAKKSTAAKAVIDAVAAATGVTVGPIVNVELGKMTGGQYSLLPEGAPITLAFGVPASFAKGAANLAVIKVTTTGVAILPDLDTNPNTVTFNTTGGQAVYAIVKY